MYTYKAVFQILALKILKNPALCQGRNCTFKDNKSARLPGNESLVKFS